MNILQYIKGVIYGLLLKIFPSLSYKGVVNTEIKCYKKIKKTIPELSENDILNHLIITRIESMPRVATKEEEYIHYNSVLKKNDKSLEDVIFAIVEYEYILSREKQVINQLTAIGLSLEEIHSEINQQKIDSRTYIRHRIDKILNN